MDEHPDLAALRARLDEEERAYASLLAALDALAAFARCPRERLPELPEQMAHLNRVWELPGPPDERRPQPAASTASAGSCSRPCSSGRPSSTPRWSRS